MFLRINRSTESSIQGTSRTQQMTLARGNSSVSSGRRAHQLRLVSNTTSPLGTSAEKVAKMPADGVVIAKEAFRLVEQNQAYQGEEVASYLFHAFGTNLQFAPGEFNFVKTRAQVGAKQPRQRESGGAGERVPAGDVDPGEHGCDQPARAQQLEPRLELLPHDGRRDR